RCSASTVVKVGGICCAISTGALSIAGPIAASTALSACGPPVDAPIRSTRGGEGNTDRRNGVGLPLESNSVPRTMGAGVRAGPRGSASGNTILRRATRPRILLGVLQFTIGLRLGHIIGCSERERTQADFRVAAGQRGNQEHDQMSFSSQASAAERRARPRPAW